MQAEGGPSGAYLARIVPDEGRAMARTPQSVSDFAPSWRITTAQSSPPTNSTGGPNGSSAGLLAELFSAISFASCAIPSSMVRE